MKTFEKVWNESKKKFPKEKLRQKNSSSGILAIEGNTNSKKAGSKVPKKDLFEITYYNYNKKGHYTKTYPKSKKNNIPKN